MIIMRIKNLIFKIILALFLLFCLILNAEDNSSQNKAKAGWDIVPDILARIILPSFPNKDFNIIDFGAIGNGEKDCTYAFKRAIEKCNASGGGRVVVPDGKFLTGAIKLKSNVNLHLNDNSVILFSTDPKNYLPVVFTRWECTEVYNYSSLIYAFKEKNIAVTGKGVLEGQASLSNWWGWERASYNDSYKLVRMANENVPVNKRIFGKGYYLRPNFIQFVKCADILIDGVTIRNSPMWTIHPVYCKNVAIQNVSVYGDGPNTDGCDPDSCSDVLIKDCKFSTGDDCIAIKSGRNADGRRVNIPCENIVIQNCRMENGHGGITCGSETAGGIRNVFGENCTMSSQDHNMPIRLKSNSERGGFIENVYFRNISVGQASRAGIHITKKYASILNGSFPPMIRNIEIRDSNFSNMPQAVFIEGLPDSKVENVYIVNCSFSKIDNPNTIENTVNFKMDNVYINGELK